MNVLIIGQGGREHALAWKVADSEKVKRIWVAPGNAGTALEPKTKNVRIDSTAVDELVDFAKKNDITLTIVGPEVALAAGVVDAFQKENLAIFGPTQAAAQLESSKIFSKQFMARYHIPTASFRIFSHSQQAIDYLKTQSFPVVIKADGLAAGKGVIIEHSLEAAQQAVIDILDNHRFGKAGRGIVIEQFVVGEELSFMALVDGQHILPLATSRDYKRREAADEGLNTGGMGAYSPLRQLSDKLHQKIMLEIMEPTVAALQQENIPYVGFLYAGLMITPAGNPILLEFNVRLGDPETQPLMMRLRSDLVTLIQFALRGQLDKKTIHWDERTALAVVLTSAGYPLDHRKNDRITGLEQLGRDPLLKIFHAGTRRETDHILLTDGGRVLSITALGDDLSEARVRAYAAARAIAWSDCYYRPDIGAYV